MMTTELLGHTTPDTGYLVSDYPYGFTLRTEIRYWVETKKGFGQRLMSQTRNPKKPGHPWNKPKGSTYSAVVALYLDPATGYVEHAGLTGYSTEDTLAAFQARFPLTSAEPRNAQTLKVLLAQHRAASKITWTVTSAADGPHQTEAEQNRLLRDLTFIELRKMDASS